jgi:hypothetical protein
MADTSGPRGTGNITQSIRKIDMSETVLELEPNSYPLTVLSNRLNSKKTSNPEFSWQQDQLRVRFDQVNNGAGYTSGATAIVVDTPAIYAQYDLVKVTRTGETMRVVSVNSGTSTLTVIRGVGGGAAALVDNDPLLVGSTAQPEGDTSKPARSGNPTKVTNYTQIVRTPYESTETLIHSDTFTAPSDWDRNARHASIEHAKGLEYMKLHGRPSEDLTGSQPLRTSGGALYWIATNITAAGGTLSETAFWGAFRNLFRYGNQDSKILLASRLLVDVLQGFPRGKLNVLKADGDTYGLNVRQFESAHGTLNVVTHNLLEGATYGGYGIVLDLSLIKNRPLANDQGSRATHIRQQIQANDADTRKDELLTEEGLEFGQEKAHGLISGVTG